MTVVIVVTIGFAFASGVRGSFFVMTTLIALVVTMAEIVGGHFWPAVAYNLGMQGAYVTGLLINAMRR